MTMQTSAPITAPDVARRQTDMFGEDIQREIDEARRRHAMAYHLSAQRCEKRRRELIADESPWKDHPLAPRVRAMVQRLQAAGPQGEGMLGSIMTGLHIRARHGQIDKMTIDFLEEKVRLELARISQANDRPATIWNERTAQTLAIEDAAVAALPLGIRQAAAVRINELGRRLAALGYRDHYEVNTGSPEDARQLHRDIADIYNAMMSLAPARYRAEKGYRNFKRANLERDETELSALLGIDTRELPGVCMDQPLTSGGVRQETVRGKASRRARSDQAGTVQPQAPNTHQPDLLAP